MLAPGGSCSCGEGKAEMQTPAWLVRRVLWVVGTRAAQALLGFQGTSVLLTWDMEMGSGDPSLLSAVAFC